MTKKNVVKKKSQKKKKKRLLEVEVVGPSQFYPIHQVIAFFNYK